MNLLIVAATAGEVAPFAKYMQDARINNLSLFKRITGDILITGVGMTATTFALTRQLQTNMYDMVIQAGAGGSFDRTLALGSLVFVTSDLFADMGAEDHDEYIDVFEMGLVDKNSVPYNAGKLDNQLLPVHSKIRLPQVSGLTVNTVSGSERTIKLRTEKYGCSVESMEGAAFHYVCLQENVPFAQVRAISNYVTPRDKSQWQMPQAIINLNNWLIGFIEAL